MRHEEPVRTRASPTSGVIHEAARNSVLNRRSRDGGTHLRGGPPRPPEACKAIAADEKRLEQLLARLGPAWVELRAALNGVAKRLDG
jgi:hypothetical protein